MIGPNRVIAVHEALAAAQIQHAVGGAIALGIYAEPRETKDIDVNVFLPPERRAEVEQALAPLEASEVHLFFAEDALHEEMAAAVRHVPFADSTIPIVAAEHLVIRKALLDRPKDWLDIEAILVATEPLDLETIEAWLRRLAGVHDPRLAKFRELVDRLGL